MTHKLRSYILNKAQAYLTDHSTSMKKILNQLSNIFLIEYNLNLFQFYPLEGVAG